MWFDHLLLAAIALLLFDCVVSCGCYILMHVILSCGRDDNKGLAIMSRHRYPVEQSRVFERTTREKLCTALESFIQGNSDEHLDNSEHGNGNPNSSEKQGVQKIMKPIESKKNDNNRAKQASLKVVLGEALGYGPALSEHIILDAGLMPSTKVGKDFKLDDKTTQVLAEAVMRFEDWLADVISGEKVPEGYILMQPKNPGKQNNAVSEKGTSQQVIFDIIFFYIFRIPWREMWIIFLLICCFQLLISSLFADL